jgi:hypothetical protein
VKLSEAIKAGMAALKSGGPISTGFPTVEALEAHNELFSFLKYADGADAFIEVAYVQGRRDGYAEADRCHLDL